MFNDTPNTFFLQLYGVGHRVKEYSDSERGNPLPPPYFLFLISSNGFLTCIISIEMAFGIPVVEH